MPYLPLLPTPPPKIYLLHVLKKWTLFRTGVFEESKVVTAENQENATESIQHSNVKCDDLSSRAWALCINTSDQREGSKVTIDQPHPSLSLSLPSSIPILSSLQKSPGAKKSCQEKLSYLQQSQNWDKWSHLKQPQILCSETFNK